MFFLRHLIGLMKPVSGEILFEGRDIGGINSANWFRFVARSGCFFKTVRFLIR